MKAADAWLTRFLAGDARALARGLSWLEAADPRGAALLIGARSATRERADAARIIGLTGAPGAGKSTLADRLIEAWRARGERVAVLAVDPSSPYSGGALLGDRVRMTRWASDAGVFVRSMASRGRTGGLAPATLDALALLAAFGFDVVLLETVGVGQAEVDVAAVADTTVVALPPGQGDDVQAAKAGLMEIADVFALTKADRPEAERLAREVRASLLEHAAPALRDAVGSPVAVWRPALVMVAAGVAAADLPPTVAADGGVGELLDAIEAHAEHLRRSGEDHERRAARARLAVGLRAQAVVQAVLGALPGERWDAVAAGQASVDALVAEALAVALRELRDTGAEPAPADPRAEDC
ncbi:MAG: methylmalonyl Co-A mutase-associated GTPase MeaB [Trueperaceae bacterium]